jgi:hypothetical protein
LGFVRDQSAHKAESFVSRAQSVAMNVIEASMINSSETPAVPPNEFESEVARMALSPSSSRSSSRTLLPAPLHLPAAYQIYSRELLQCANCQSRLRSCPRLLLPECIAILLRREDCSHPPRLNK